MTATNGTNGHSSSSSGLTPAHPAFDSIPAVIKAFRNDEFVIVLDSPDRENEGDLIIAASALTEDRCSFLLRHTSGYICAPLTVARAAALNLPQMVAENADPNQTAYTVSVDAIGPGVTTGISARDRSFTCRMLADPRARAEDFRRPGHVLPLQARAGGVRVRKGHTEAAVDLCRLAGKEPVGVICEMITHGQAIEGMTAMSGGGMMRRDECLAFGKEHRIKVCTIEDLRAYIVKMEGEWEVEEVKPMYGPSGIAA